MDGPQLSDAVKSELNRSQTDTMIEDIKGEEELQPYKVLNTKSLNTVQPFNRNSFCSIRYRN